MFVRNLDLQIYIIICLTWCAIRVNFVIGSRTWYHWRYGLWYNEKSKFVWPCRLLCKEEEADIVRTWCKTKGDLLASTWWTQLGWSLPHLYQCIDCEFEIVCRIVSRMNGLGSLWVSRLLLFVSSLSTLHCNQLPRRPLWWRRTHFSLFTYCSDFAR